VWAFAGLGCGVLLADWLNRWSLGGFPLGFWFAQQGSILVFVLLILVYALAMRRLDRRHHAELEALGRAAGGGMSLQAWTFLFVGLSFSLYLFIAWRTRVRDTQGFYVAGRGVPAAANGMATAADWMSAASFLSMAGIISTMGYAGGVYLMGWTGGFVLLALLLAPSLRKFGRFTVPDFVGDRYESNGWPAWWRWSARSS
jgi:putative solute:sodium symporter small subunit